MLRFSWFDEVRGSTKFVICGEGLRWEEGYVPIRLKGLRWVRERVPLSQEDLAQESGLSRRTVGALENGDRGAHPATVDKLARALGVEAGLLIDGPDDGGEVHVGYDAPSSRS